MEEKIKKRTKDLEKAKKNAETADKLKTTFLENLSHEIRTPLNAVVGFTTLLETEENLSIEGTEKVSNIIRGSNTITKIIDSIMEASRLQIGDIKLYEKEFSVYEMINELIFAVKENQIFQRKKGLHIRKNLEDIINYSIFSDPDKLFTIFHNLLDNAVKFTEEGFIDINVSIENKSTLFFMIKDTGVGIKEEDTKYIFEKFRKIESDHSKLYSGLGLGLNITKSLVRLLKGNISVESEPGKGTQFTVTIPVSNIKHKKQSTGKQIIELKNRAMFDKRILIAEDEQLNLLLLTTILNNTGAKVLVAKNGIEAVKVFEENKDIDLILMDIKMPELNGIEATKRIRTFDKGKTVKIIAQTAYTIEYQKKKILDSGFDDFISKPIDLQVIISKIKKHLNI